jgi:hypothetical protein
MIQASPRNRCRLKVVARSWLLIPCPFLGPSSWRPVADVLADQGHRVAIASTTMTGRDEPDHVEPWVQQILDFGPAETDDAVVVVGHSAAVPRLPLVVDRLLARGEDVVAMVAVDGRFPDGRAFTEAEPNYGDLLDGLLRPDDYLPPWPRWWGSLVSGLVVEEMARHLVFDEAPPIPRSWFDQACPVPPLPESVRKAFLAFGPAYVDSRDRAKADGWFTLTLTGDHLHQVVAPDAVAATLVAMVACMMGESGEPGVQSG